MNDAQALSTGTRGFTVTGMVSEKNKHNLVTAPANSAHVYLKGFYEEIVNESKD